VRSYKRGKSRSRKIWQSDNNITVGAKVNLTKWRKGFKEKLHLLWEVLTKFNHDHGFFLSSGITFNLLICLIPFILLLLALLGTYLYSYREVMNHIRHYMEDAFPSLDPKIMNNLLRIIRDRKIVGGLGILGLVWTSTWVFSSLRTALNIIFRVEKSQGILRGIGIDLLMILSAGIFLLMSMVLTSGVTFVQGYRFGPFLSMMPFIRFILKYLTPFFFTFWMCFLIYKIIPNMKIHFKTALQAALFASLLWEMAKQLFGWYVLHLGGFSILYGSLSTLAIFFLWIYYSSVILLLGGEVAFLLEGRRR
jgi:membrane protein